ncbi:Asr1405/Asl0597 family protein [Kamptonema sp. UHCC 0994]|uniref:Asr1405/Asl0597 family protein n=1 Tax=Kamptonema sp. UHCC 0994 TaxID=3031329 RepID=UPI0023B942DA|nr:Asr1405/Asl0597 family protein [Kamptonema sp. UHCC 0994]MDF0555531.1 hypothetical protein [Kamptonema sp. UHCC 0994]
MNKSELESEPCHIVEVSWVDRWQVYQRLQELEITCWCAIDRPLRVQINSALQAAQLESVLRQYRSPRWELEACLEGCWKNS